MLAAIYARYSSENQRHASIEAQIRIIKQYTDTNEITIVKEYIDEAKSATTDQRPAFQEMIEDAKSGLFDMLIVHKLDRFARDKHDSVVYKRILRDFGVNLVSVTEPLDDSPESKMMETMYEGMAEYYSRNLSREVQKGLNENALKCLNTGGKPPFGFDVDPLTKEYKINEDEAYGVRKIFQLYDAGKSYKEIILWLNNNGFKTKKGQSFVQTSLHSLLRNEKYIGTYIFNKNSRSKYAGVRSETEVIRIENGIPPIIPKELFMRTQTKLEQNKRLSQRLKAKEPYLLSGKAICGMCGGKMFGNRRKNSRGKKISYWAGYQCSTRKKTKGCEMSEVKKEHIEQAVLEHLDKKVFTERFIESIIDLFFIQQDQFLDDIKVGIELLKKKISKIDVKTENLLEAISNGMYHPSMKEKLETLESEKSMLLKEITYESAYVKRDYSREDIKDLFNLGKDLVTKPKEEQQKMIEIFIEKVVIHEKKVDVHLKLDKYQPSICGINGAP